MTSGVVGGAPKRLFLSDEVKKLLGNIASREPQTKKTMERYQTLLEKPVTELRQNDMDELESLVEHLHRRAASYMHGID